MENHHFKGLFFLQIRINHEQLKSYNNRSAKLWARLKIKPEFGEKKNLHDPEFIRFRNFHLKKGRTATCHILPDISQQRERPFYVINDFIQRIYGLAIEESQKEENPFKFHTVLLRELYL